MEKRSLIQEVNQERSEDPLTLRAKNVLRQLFKGWIPLPIFEKCVTVQAMSHKEEKLWRFTWRITQDLIASRKICLGMEDLTMDGLGGIYVLNVSETGVLDCMYCLIGGRKMYKIKKRLFLKYYDLLILLEDIFGYGVAIVNRHRRRLDDD